MTKGSKLLVALNAHKGKQYEFEKQKTLRKKAEKKKKAEQESQPSKHDNGHEEELKVNHDISVPEQDSDGWESDESEDAPTPVSEKHVSQLFHKLFYWLLLDNG